MNVLPLLVLCSLLLVAASVVLFILSARRGDCHQADRLCLLPLEDDDPVPKPPPAAASPPAPAPAEPPRLS